MNSVLYRLTRLVPNMCNCTEVSRFVLEFYLVIQQLIKATINDLAMASTWIRANTHGSVWLFSLLKDCCCSSTSGYYSRGLSLINCNSSKILKILNTTRSLVICSRKFLTMNKLSQLIFLVEVVDLSHRVSKMIINSPWSKALIQETIDFIKDNFGWEAASKQKMIRNRKRRGRSIPSAVSG